MLTVEQFYLLVGEDMTEHPVREHNYAALQIQVASEAIRNYCRRYLSLMVWEDRFQRPNAITLHETPIVLVDRVIVDGHRLPEEAYYFHHISGRLFTRAIGGTGWPWGNMWWVNDGLSPEELPQYYGNWKGAGSVKVLYKAGFDPVPMVLQQVIADYVYERLLTTRAMAASGGGTPIPVGTITQIAIEGVGSVRYADGASTTASNSRRAQLSGEPVIGAAGPLLDHYLEVATVVPGLYGLVSHRKVIMSASGQLGSYSGDPGDLILYSDDPGDYLLEDTTGGSAGELILVPRDAVGLGLWNGVLWNNTLWSFP